jgi:predicted aconitase with swiveling domain/protein-tyrosine phosphatase
MSNVLSGQVVIAGRVAGPALAANEPLSFWGGYDYASGEIIDRRHPLSGQHAAGRVLCLPFTRGSSTTTAVLLEAVKAGTAPAAIITTGVDTFFALASVVADEMYGQPVPLLALAQQDFARLRSGDWIALDGDGTLMVQPRPNDNTYWVSERLLAGEYPGHWDDAVARQRLQAYLDSGVTCFVDLTEDGELAPYDHLLPMHGANGQRIIYQRMAIRDLGLPRSPEFMAAILDRIEEAVGAGHTVNVHCWGGIGRTGTVVGCYLARQGCSGDEALAEIASHWQTVEKHTRHPRSPEMPEQMAYVRLWASQSGDETAHAR